MCKALSLIRDWTFYVSKKATFITGVTGQDETHLAELFFTNGIDPRVRDCVQMQWLML
jgi:hypothetical protein